MPQSQANSFDELNTAFVSSVTQLPEINKANLKPEKIIQSSGNIRGWIDVVGFRDVIRMDRIYYINGSPADKALIQYDAWGEDVSVDSVTKTTTVYVSENNIVAQMYVTLFWHYYYSCNCNKNGCSTCRKDVIEHATFYDYEPIISQYNYSSIPSIILHESINSSKKLLEVNIDDTVTSYNVKTKNGSVTKHIKIGQVAYTAKGVPYANFSMTKQITIWNSTGYGVYHQGNDVTIDSSNFSFSARTPFSNVSEANITKMIHPPSSMSILNILIFVMFGLGYITCMFAAKMSKIKI